MTFRSLADTTQATLDFHFSRSAERQAEMRLGAPGGAGGGDPAGVARVALTAGRRGRATCWPS